MSLHASTLLLIVLRSQNEECVLSLINQSLAEARIIDSYETSETPLPGIPFPHISNEQCITLALSRPLSHASITDLARLVTTGMIAGFLVRGDIEMSNDEEPAPMVTERDRYHLAVDTGTTEDYDTALRREAFRQDERRRSLLPERTALTS